MGENGAREPVMSLQLLNGDRETVDEPRHFWTHAGGHATGERTPPLVDQLLHGLGIGVH